MSGFVAAGQVLDASYSDALVPDLLNALRFVPLADTEIYVVSHHFPLCVHQVEGNQASVCALLERSHLARPLADASGRWFGSYRPMALRCAPFRLSSVLSGNPLHDLEIWQGALLPTAPANAPQKGFRIGNADGKLSPDVGTIYAGLRQVHASHLKLDVALDQMFLGGFLMPLAQDRPTALTPVLKTISEIHFEDFTNRTLTGMARQTFVGIELAVAMIFSQIHLAPDCRPAFVERLSLKHLRDDQQAAEIMATTLENLGHWLDESELFSLDQLVGFDQMPQSFKK